MIYPKSKIEIVNTILSETKEDPDFPWNNREPDKLVFEWFVTGRVGEGLRLSDIGAKAFEKANIASYTFDIQLDPNQPFNNYAMRMNKKIRCPYYIGVKLDEKKKKRPFIRIYDHKIAMLMTLYGSVDDYMDSVK
jgi:hypothetical protein